MVNLYQSAAALCLVAGLAGCGPAEPPTPIREEAVAVPSAPALPVSNYALNDAASRLSFVSIKAGDIVETHRFDRISGDVSGDGSGRLVVDLASVNTAVDIRNERMREVFFETATYPEAIITTSINPSTFEALAIGERVEQELEASLSLHGVELPMYTTIAVTMASGYVAVSKKTSRIRSFLMSTA
ncbi:MAG: YceI family protein, partial [Pseudomonadota bacterium]